MGSPGDEKGRCDDEIQHAVTLTQAYYLQTTPVTQSQWVALMTDNPSHFQGEHLPVENVSWADCQAFLVKLNALDNSGYRLPTEAEWEYACRAGTQSPFGIGNGLDLDSTQANFDGHYPYGSGQAGPYVKMTTPVRTYAPNAWGLYDMHGNVWEWCQDEQGDYGTDPQPPGLAFDFLRINRGGSWSNLARSCRSAYRNTGGLEERHNGLGFRVAYTAAPAPTHMDIDRSYPQPRI